MANQPALILPLQTGSPRRFPIGPVLVFLITLLLLFLGMDRGFDFYDEGLDLVDAMQVAAGQVPHRDFYANYGPGQFYILAWLFDLFGTSVFVERMYDLVLRSAIVTATYSITTVYCKRWLVVSTTIVCAFWMFSAGLPTIAYPIIPILLLVLCGSMLLLSVCAGGRRPRYAAVAGCITGLVALFRYDIGVALMLVHLTFLCVAAFLRRRIGDYAGATIRSTAVYYLAGVAALFLPPALLYLSVASIHQFVYDIFLYSAKYYLSARRVPFPRLHWRSFENLAVYLPVAVAILCVSALILAKPAEKDVGQTGVLSRPRSQFVILFALLVGAFFIKGIVRISVGQMLPSIVLAAITLAVLYDFIAPEHPGLNRLVQFSLALSMFTATWSALKEVRVLYLSHTSVLQELWSPPGPAALASETDWCAVPNRLHTGLCFLVDPGHAALIRYLLLHTQPSERIFIGLSRHDRIVSNDLLTYFASERLPATHWAHFDPDLQTTAPIHTDMIQELHRQAVRYVVLESQYDALVEPWNDSSKSTGITLLDDYIRQNYRQVQAYGAISVWLRHGAQP